MRFQERTRSFYDWAHEAIEERGILWGRRIITSPTDREVEVVDPFTGRLKRMLMFGSNDYLGLANHPHVRERVVKAARNYGPGLTGSPLLSGYTTLHRELEERIAAFKQAEDALLFANGYGAGVGTISALTNQNDIVLYDESSHASFQDGLKMASAKASYSFSHNSTESLTDLLKQHTGGTGDVFVHVEGVYSMDGDLAPLHDIVPLCRQYEAILIVDDAHGTGVLGERGHGTDEHFRVAGEVDVLVGTLSKALGVQGGFAVSTKEVVSFMRAFSRPYVFSASMTPPVVAAALAGFDVIEREPERITRLHENVRYVTEALRRLGLKAAGESPIFPLVVPEHVKIQDAVLRFDEAGLFVNAVEYPAVPIHRQQFRVSLAATHTREDLDRLLEVVSEIWKR